MTSLGFRDGFANAEIHAFEPFPIVAEKLREFTRGGKIEIHQFAFSDDVGSITVPGPTSAVCTVGSIEKGADIGEAGEPVEIALDTIDAFCDAQGIETVHILKIDTEGHDEKVLRGATSMLENGRIENVIVETNWTPQPRAVSLDEFESVLGPFGFQQYSIYDITHRRDGRLAYFNALFKKS